MPVPQGTYNYWLAPYVWRSVRGDEEGWVLPAGTKSGIDLRPFPAQIIKGVADGFGFFAIEPGAPDPAGGVLLFNGFEQRMPASNRREFESRFELGDGDLDLPNFKRSLFTLLTDHADVLGTNGPRPLMPERSSGKLRIWMSGHNGPVYSEGFDKARHPKVRAVVLEDLKGLPPLDRQRRIMRLREKYKFTEDELRAAPRGGASLSDNFNRSNEGPPMTGWSDVDGTHKVVSNQAQGDGGGTWPRGARYDTDLDSDDHWVEVEHLTDSGAHYGSPCARFASAADTYYWFMDRGNGTDTYIAKVVAGTNSSIGSDTNDGQNLHTDRLQCDGSTITAYQDTVEIQQLTDTSITGNVRGGFAMHSSNNSDVDDWLAEDLGGAAVVVKHGLALVGVGR